MTARDVAVRTLRSAPVTAVSRRVTKRRLRVLAYHGVDDGPNFEQHMAHVARNYVPVDQTAVVAALSGAAPLPDHAVWVTFDDGDPSVVANALPILAELNVPATMFVCPGLIESGEPFWWRIADAAEANVPVDIAHELAASLGDNSSSTLPTPISLTEQLKLVDDPVRRRLIQEISDRVTPFPSEWRQLRPAELDQWVAAGMSLGNHSWDHPCLDRCEESEQVRQVEAAHEWLTEAGFDSHAFAYPNGNYSATVEQVLERLGYRLAVLHDNRLAGTGGHSLRISRLRVEADEPVERLVSVVSGAQPAAVTLGQRLPL